MKRLFLGLQAEAPWPEEFPPARILAEESRHMTVVFLGDVEAEPLIEALPSFPHPPFPLGLLGYTDQLLFLPPKHPHVVAYHINLAEHQAKLVQFQQTLILWLKTLGYSIKDERPFLPHVTIARSPLSKAHWKLSLMPIVFNKIHLYESLGNLTYKSLWNYSLVPPFEEQEHTADVAFLVRGTTLQELCTHAKGALAFLFPPIQAFFPSGAVASFEEIVMHLNVAIAKADEMHGCPFKAVSFHGAIQHINDLLEWEMIVDV